MQDFDTLRQETLIAHLRRQIAGEVRFDPPSRRLYSTDASIYQISPLGVVLPRTLDDLVSTVQIASEMRVPIIPRGGGTSLSGQPIGCGLVIDCSKYVNKIGPVDPVQRRVRVQPGVVLEHLNRFLAPHRLQFGPDVATANRATLGGMIGNNSAGARSVAYGKTADHTRTIEAILADGSLATIAPLTAAEWTSKAQTNSIEGRAYREVRHLADQHAEEIRQRYPRILRCVSGYNLLPYVTQSGNGSGKSSLVPLLVGSEGTLMVLAEAELDLVPLPRFRGLLVPHFTSLRAALEALSICLEAKPTAVELMDRMLIDLARTQRSLKTTMQAIHGHPEALFMVEFSSDDQAEVADQVTRLQRRLQQVPGLTAAVPAVDAELRDPLWKLRSAAVPLLYGMPGDRKPVTFCEDAAVPPEKLPEFATQMRAIFQRHGTDGAFYGHASVGCLHIRPVLNLHAPEDIARMRQIMDEVTDLVLAFGGSFSGEHGDGLVRSEWNRKMYGPTLYEAFRHIKRTFDPENLLNPGKVVDAPPMTENLRYPLGVVDEPPTVFDYSQQEGFFRSIELCNGAGVCRKTQGGTMCPSYRATLDERESTRGRANALRLALTHGTSGLPPEQRLQERWLHEVMDLCLSCKACKSECPSNVDLAKLKAEFQHAYYAGRARPISHYLAANVHRLNRFGAAMAPLANWVNRRGVTRALMHHLVGIDRRRSLPPFRWRHFRRWFARHTPAATARGRRVILLDDCLTSYTEPGIGQAAVTVLEAAGYQVELAHLECCGRAMISKGFLPSARALARRQIPALAARVADGTPILGLEPSCLVALCDEWPELVPGKDAQVVAHAAHLAEHWLADQLATGQATLPLLPRPGRLMFHGHCHQRALVGVTGTAAALQQLPEAQLTSLDAGCCGMAGAFGYERDHYDISARIAGLQLLPALAEAPEATVVATGTSCRHQIKDLANRVAWHPMEVLAQALPSV